MLLFWRDIEINLWNENNNNIKSIDILQEI